MGGIFTRRIGARKGGIGSFLFDGVNDYIELSSAPVTAVPVTIACWFKADNDSTTVALAALGDAGAVSRFQLDARGATSDEVGAASVNSGGTSQVSLTGAYDPNIWYHAASRFTSITNRRAYFNGVGGTADTNSNTVSGLDSVLIGSRYSTTRGAFFPGKIAHVGIWNVALTDAEIASLAAGALPSIIQTANLKFYAPLTDGVAVDVITSTSLTVSGAVSSIDGPF